MFKMYNSYTSIKTYNITITDKKLMILSPSMVSDGKEKYFVFGEFDNNKTIMFENTDTFNLISILEHDTGFEDNFMSLEIGKSYTIKTRGLNIPFLSVYEHIIYMGSD